MRHVKSLKLIVQIPCYNEEATIIDVLNSIPKEIEGIHSIEILVVDDGSRDDTVKLAKKWGVHHIIKHRQNKGLAASFSDGLSEALRQGADIIVNMDGDNQHPGHRIPDLIKPILDETHDIVVGDRKVGSIEEFSAIKKLSQIIGSHVVRRLSKTTVADAPCGFRAYTRDAAMATNVITTFSYTMETIISAGHKRIAITHVAIPQSPKTRDSRLFKGIWMHIRRSAIAILRTYAMYEPFKIFLASGIVVFLIGIIPYLRILYLIIKHQGAVNGHIQSLILGAVFIILGLMFVMIGIVADLLSINRKLLEDALFRMKKIEYDTQVHVRPPADTIKQEA